MELWPFMRSFKDMAGFRSEVAGYYCLVGNAALGGLWLTGTGTVTCDAG